MEDLLCAVGLDLSCQTPPLGCFPLRSQSLSLLLGVSLPDTSVLHPGTKQNTFLSPGEPSTLVTFLVAGEKTKQNLTEAT